MRLGTIWASRQKASSWSAAGFGSLYSEQHDKTYDRQSKSDYALSV